MSENKKHRKSGRPRKGEPPSFPRDEVDRLLVHGEVRTNPDGDGSAVHYPSYREIAERFGCAHSLIAEFSKKNQCRRRREEARARATAQADAKLVELRATTMAMSRDDELRIVDACIARFEKTLAEERIQLSSASDINTLLRLKEYLQGGADSRSEVQTSISLEGLQTRHQQQIRAARETTPQERGEVENLVSIQCSDDEKSAQ